MTAELQAFIESNNKRLALIINIESVPGIENLSELLKWPIDAVP